jgi:1-acyl-sn-glycerol-3-phosphate acyltransferase
VARQRSGQPSGLIGRPTSRPGLLYRCLRGLCGLVGRLLFRIELHGLEHLPRTGDGRVAGGWIACGLPHRTWAEPFVLFFSLPAQPRIVMLGEGPTIFASRWRAFLVRRVGGVIPVWPGSGASGFGAVVEGVHRALAAGAVFALFPEVGPPARPPALRRVSPGVARIAQRTGVQVVPVVFGGTHDLYLRRRIVVRFLPPIPPPLPSADRGAIDAYMAEFLAVVQPAAEDAHRNAELGPPRRKVWRWLHGPFPRAD